METKINIAEILRNKPHGVKLYSPIFGDCTYCYVREDTNDIGVKKHNGVIEYFNYEGLYFALGEVMLFPSKEMRDWEKFSWKNGDVLKNTAYEERVIFDGFLNDDYTYFKGKHPLDCSDKFNISYHEECNCFTGNYRLEYTDAAQTYINTIEERLGGKLNSDTLEIEKTQPEFKDGDILSCDEDSYTRHTTLILHKDENITESIVSLIRHKELVENVPINNFLLSRLYHAREDEKKELFDALAKEGKAWDSEKKKVVNLKPKCEFKPFDKVVVRCSEADRWSIDFFSYKVHNGYICTGDAWFGYCLPYNDETVKLIGTTNDLEGGEQ